MPRDNNPIEDVEEIIENDYWKYQDSERDRGILTQSDREYLLGERELEGQSERNTRYRIRQRIIQGLYDIQLLVNDLPKQDLENLANQEGLSGKNDPTAELCEFSYQLLFHDKEIVDPIEKYESLVGGAILYGARVEGNAVPKPSVELEIEAEEIDVGQLDRKIRTGNLEPGERALAVLMGNQVEADFDAIEILIEELEALEEARERNEE